MGSVPAITRRIRPRPLDDVSAAPKVGMRIWHRVTYTPPGAAVAHYADDMPVSIWDWLLDSNNRDILAYIGAGFVGLAGLLKTIGVLGKKKTPPAPAAPAPQPATSNTQTVTAQSGGTAVGIQGHGNTVNLPADKH